jgi:hypothetical protein
MQIRKNSKIKMFTKQVEMFKLKEKFKILIHFSSKKELIVLTNKKKIGICKTFILLIF